MISLDRQKGRWLDRVELVIDQVQMEGYLDSIPLMLLREMDLFMLYLMFSFQVQMEPLKDAMRSRAFLVASEQTHGWFWNHHIKPLRLKSQLELGRVLYQQSIYYM